MSYPITCEAGQAEWDPDGGIAEQNDHPALRTVEFERVHDNRASPCWGK